MVEGMVAGMEAAGHMQDGYYVPNKHMMYAAQVLTKGFTRAWSRRSAALPAVR